MKMKKILTEWRKFIKEGVSNEDIRNQEIEKINNSNLPDKEAQRQIASIYLPMSLIGHIPRGAKEFYENKRTSARDLLMMLDVLGDDVYVHEQQNQQTTDSQYFTIETVGGLAKGNAIQKIRLRSKVTEASQAIFDSTEDLKRRIFAAEDMINEKDFDFSKLSTEFDFGMATKGGYHKGPDSGDGGIQIPKDKMSPAEIAEWEKMMEEFSKHHAVELYWNGPRDREFYLMLQRTHQERKKFYEYMYRLWLEKKGKMNYFTILFYDATFDEGYEEALQHLIDSMTVVDERSDPEKALDAAAEVIMELKKEYNDMITGLSLVKPHELPGYQETIEIIKEKMKKARKDFNVAKRNLRDYQRQLKKTQGSK
jgi:hypothetical protein